MPTSSKDSSPTSVILESKQMKKTLLAILLFSSPVYAGPIHMNPYLPTTPCSGSWDGPGQTACEKLGSVGSIMNTTFVNGFGFNAFAPITPFPLIEITALDKSNTFTQVGRDLIYFTGLTTWSTKDNPNQFAIWRDDEKPNRIYIGIEDLFVDGYSDRDYNDYVVIMERQANVPEPGSLLYLAGFALTAARFLTRRK